MQVLDELARVFHVVRGGRPLQIMNSVSLGDQFGGPMNPVQWKQLQRLLGCRLPPLECGREGWCPPLGWTTIWDLAEYLIALGPGREPPAQRSPAAWREAQVFCGVRSVLVETGNHSPDKVVRSARLVPDLFPD
jgi:hypothetical protein